MQKLARMSVALALAAIFVSPAYAAKTNPMKVVSGSVQATVNGVTKTYGPNEEIPEGAVLTVTSDVKIVSGGMSVEAKAGATLQAARTDDGKIDVRSNGGGALTVKGFGNTTIIPEGGEANVSPSVIQSIKGTVTVTNQRGTITLAAGQQTAGSFTAGSRTVVVGIIATDAVTILPNVQQNTACGSSVSPSAPCAN